jgi:ubiquinone/menaquinone biosynthesis C-methylase UbiE
MIDFVQAPKKIKEYMPSSDSYILQVGQQGSDRLKLLDEIYGPFTQNFIKRAGLQPGMEVIDIGCGTGNTSCWLAKEVGSGGRVLGVDISEEQINSARETAKHENISNIDFICCSVYELATLKKQFDFVFSRFVLVHLTEPYRAWENMYSLVKSNGILAIDEQNLQNAAVLPSHPAFSKSIQLALQLAKIKKINLDFGAELYSLFHTKPFGHISVNVVQPALTLPNQKMMWPLAYIEMKQNFILEKLISEQEIFELIKDLMDIVYDDKFCMLTMRNFQVYGIKK